MKTLNWAMMWLLTQCQPMQSLQHLLHFCLLAWSSYPCYWCSVGQFAEGVSILHFLNIFDCVVILDVSSSDGPSSMLTSPSTCSVNYMVGVSEWGQLERGMLEVESVLSLYCHTSDPHYYYHYYIWPFLGVIWPEVFCGLPCQYVHLRFAFQQDVLHQLYLVASLASCSLIIVVDSFPFVAYYVCPMNGVV